MHYTPHLSSRRHSRSRRAAAGFTLTEILIAIALIVMVVAAAVTELGGIFSGGQAQIATVFVKQDIDTPLLAYKMATGSYPTTEQGLKALIVAPDGVTGWHGPYLNTKDIPKDPWGSDYQYRYPGVHNPQSYDVWSLGPSKTDGSTDNIGNW
jgi:general secretion pathway protein G